MVFLYFNRVSCSSFVCGRNFFKERGKVSGNIIYLSQILLSLSLLSRLGGLLRYPQMSRDFLRKEFYSKRFCPFP